MLDELSEFVVFGVRYVYYRCLLFCGCWDGINDKFNFSYFFGVSWKLLVLSSILHVCGG